MKIKYYRPNNLFDYLYDSYIITGNKKKIFKNKKYSHYSSAKKDLMSFIGYIVLLIICILFYIKTGFIFAKVMSYIIILCIFIMTFSFINFIYMYFKTKDKDLSGTLLIDEIGITDKDANTKLLFKWKMFSYVIIGKKSINIFMKNQAIYLRLPIDIKKQLVKALEKYSNIEIIDLTINN